ncbi:MAG: LPS assembly lipoprotein LptE [Planctomycetota bacterium]|nr:LPS assembly lipoprotein LptE [Planctomycetota bacterium]
MFHSLSKLWLVLSASLALSGCTGYQLGNENLFRPDIRTVQVPIIQSESFRQGLGERLTEAVVKEIELRTPYKVVSAESADSIFRAQIVNEQKRVIAENTFDEARDIEVQMVIEVSWLDRRGQQLIQRSQIPFDEGVYITQAANFVPEGGQSLVTAQQEVIRKLAAQIVSQMELPW